jgi:hypothetical protein
MSEKIFDVKKILPFFASTSGFLPKKQLKEKQLKQSYKWVECRKATMWQSMKDIGEKVFFKSHSWDLKGTPYLRFRSVYYSVSLLKDINRILSLMVLETKGLWIPKRRKLVPIFLEVKEPYGERSFFLAIAPCDLSDKKQVASDEK